MNDCLIISYKKGNKDALNTLLENNIKLIHFAANKFYQGTNELVELEDLTQEAYIGFLRAVELYNPNREHKTSFSNYSFYHMNGRMIRFLKNNSKNKETSIYLQVSGVDDEIYLIDQLYDEDRSSEAFDYVYRKQLEKEIDELLTKELTLLQRNIVKAYYGFYGTCYTKQEIANTLNEESTTINNKHRQAIKKLSESSYIRVLRNERRILKLTKTLFNPECHVINKVI